jgi:hypothetical protein
VEDAKPGPFDQIKAGDQLNARGTRSPDGSEVAAEEVVSGPFPYIEGTIEAIDVANNTMTVEDATRKSAVVVKVTAESLLWKLPAEMAQRIAMRLKNAGGTAGGSGDQPDGQGRSTSGQGGAPRAGAARPGTESQGSSGPGGGQGGNGPPDMQRMLSRLPKCTLADLQKGDAVMIVSAEGGDAGTVTAIKLLAGVDAILRAAPNRSASSLLSSWSLGAPGGEGEAAQQ